MDGLVFKRFDFKKRAIVQKLEEDIRAVQGDYNKRGMLHSGGYVKKFFDLMAQSAEKNIEALLETYSEVGQSTGENVILDKESEIRNEIQELAIQEGRRVNEKVSEMAQRLQFQPPQEMSFFSTNLLTDARDKAEILVETTKRRIRNKIPKKTWTNEVFVIMQIGDVEMDKIWTNVYLPVIQDFKFDPRRIDRHNTGRFLMSEVVDLLNRSRLIIADLTNERPNCYLEVGYALGTEKFNHLILCAREDHNPESPNYQKGGPKVHFDIGGYDILFWNENKIDDFKTALAKKINYRLEVIKNNG